MALNEHKQRDNTHQKARTSTLRQTSHLLCCGHSLSVTACEAADAQLTGTAAGTFEDDTWQVAVTQAVFVILEASWIGCMAILTFLSAFVSGLFVSAWGQFAAALRLLESALGLFAFGLEVVVQLSDVTKRKPGSPAGTCSSWPESSEKILPLQEPNCIWVKRQPQQPVYSADN